ncbi:unnamed protein product [Arabidopsis lyrata]|nr:unnamed protein product [Arabidopsis lyrata]
MAPTTQAAHYVKSPMAELAERIDNLSTTVAEHTRQFVEKCRRHEEEMREQDSRREGRIPVKRRYHKVRKKITRKRLHEIVPATQINTRSMKNYGKGPRSPLIESRFRSQQLLYQQIQDDARREPSSGYDVSHSQELSDGFEDRREIGNNFHRTIPQIASDKVCDDFNAERVELSRWNVAHKEDTKWNVYNEPNGTMQQMVKELMCSSTGVEYEISRCSANDLITWINNWETYLCESKTPQTQCWKEFKCMLGQETKITREVARELWGQDMDGVDVKRSRALHIHMGLSTNSRGNNLHHNVTDSVMMERNGIIRNGSMFWTNSAKAWEQVSSDAHELRVGAESIRVLCIGFREIAPQNTIEAVPYVLPAREVQETQSLGATRGREISQAHSQEFNGVKKGIIGPVIEGTLKRARQSRYLGIFQERTVSEYWTRFEKLCLNSMTLPGQHDV